MKQNSITILLMVALIWAAVFMVIAVSLLLKGISWILVQLELNFKIGHDLIFAAMAYFIIILLGIIIALITLFLIKLSADKKQLEAVQALYAAAKAARDEQTHYLSGLFGIAQLLSSVLSKDKLMRLILESVIDIAKKLSPAPMGFLLIYYNEKGEFSYETGYGIDKTMLTKLDFNPQDEIISQVVRTRKLVVINQALAKYNFFRKDKITLHGDDITLFVIPLIVANSVMGIIKLFCGNGASNIINEQNLFFTVLIKQASIALGSAVQSELAVIDVLTKLYNHGYFMRVVRNEVERARRYKSQISLLMIDIDHFKQINDTYGHQQGDVVLSTIARIIKDGSRMMDFCARYGGEEFVVILPETGLFNAEVSAEEFKKMSLEQVGGALTKAERLRKEVENYENFGYGMDVKIKVTISVGVSMYDSSAGEGDYMRLIKLADQELYRAKNEGRNRVCYSL